MICQYTQFRLSNIDGAEPSLRMRRHLRSCARCRVFKGKLAGLDENLRGTASLAPAPVLPNRKRGRNWIPAIAFGAMATTLTMLALYFWSGRSGEDTGNQAAVNSLVDSSDSTQVSKSTNDPFAPNEESVPKTGTSLISKRLRGMALLQSVSPLERELEALQHDGKRGLNRLLALGSTGTGNTRQ